MNANPAGGAREKSVVAISRKTREVRLEERILTLALKFGVNIGSIEEAKDFFSAPGREIVSRMLCDGGFSEDGILAETKKYYEELLIAAGNETIGERAATDEIAFHIAAIKNNLFKNSLAGLACELARAEKSGDIDAVRRLREEYNNLSKKTAISE
jgi:hypothetical protein